MNEKEKINNIQDELIIKIELYSEYKRLVDKKSIKLLKPVIGKTLMPL